MSSKRSILLGLFFLLTLSVLGYYTLFLTDFTLFGKHAELVIHFSKTKGLREGDPVLVAGMRWGRVKTLTFDPLAPNDRRITVTASLNEPLILREGAKIVIEDATLLGGRNLAIDPGPADAPQLNPSLMLFGEVAANPLDALTDMVNNSEKGVTQIVDDLRFLTQGVRTGKGVVGRLFTDEELATHLSDTLAGAAATLTNLEALTSDLRQGKGTAGQLVTNPELFEQLTAAARKLTAMIDDTSAVMKDVREGNGVVGRMLADPKLAEDFTTTVAALRVVAEKISRGEGTLGLLIGDDEIGKNVATITGKIASGDGTLGALIARDDVYENLRNASENVDVMTSAVRNGQGTLGRLVMDPELYNQMKVAMQILTRSLEEYREAAPITTFTSVFFSAF